MLSIKAYKSFKCSTAVVLLSSMLESLSLIPCIAKTRREKKKKAHKHKSILCSVTKCGPCEYLTISPTIMNNYNAPIKLWGENVVPELTASAPPGTR